MSNDFPWTPPTLSLEDEKLISAYQEIGRPLEDLPYTDAFEQLCRMMKIDSDDMPAKHAVFRRLIILRKQAILPRVRERALAD